MKHRTPLEIKELDRLIAFGAEQGWKNEAIAAEAGVSQSYSLVRLKALGYRSMLVNSWEADLIREARRQKAIAA